MRLMKGLSSLRSDLQGGGPTIKIKCFGLLTHTLHFSLQLMLNTQKVIVVEGIVLASLGPSARGGGAQMFKVLQLRCHFFGCYKGKYSRRD